MIINELFMIEFTEFSLQNTLCTLKQKSDILSHSKVESLMWSIRFQVIYFPSIFIFILKTKVKSK